MFLECVGVWLVRCGEVGGFVMGWLWEGIYGTVGGEVDLSFSIVVTRPCT